MSAELVIPEGVTASLDLNGKTLNRGLGEVQEDGSVILVSPGAVLTVLDSNEYNAGTITGGASMSGGGICNLGTLYLNGGTVKNNKATDETDGSGAGFAIGALISGIAVHAADKRKKSAEA